MSVIRLIGFGLLATAIITSPCDAGELGLPAPALQVEAWIKGNRVNLAEGRGKNIYVVEFWATWCGSCMETIPHLSELQKQHKKDGVVFVGISDEKPDVIKSFLKKHKLKMDYVVAADAEDKTTDAYLKPFGVESIPHAFIIDRSGALVWHGEPRAEFTEALNAVIAGKFDLPAARAHEKFQERIDHYFALAAKGDKTAVETLGKQLLTEANHTGLLNLLALRIVTDRELQVYDYPLALEAARKANELSGMKSASYLDTLARAQFANGKIAEAVATEKQALLICKDQELRSDLEAHLEKFSHKLPK